MRGELLQEGDDLAIIAIGVTVYPALEAATITKDQAVEFLARPRATAGKEHVRDIGTFAEAAVVGSALVSVVEASAGQDDLPKRIAERVRWLKGGVEVCPA